MKLFTELDLPNPLVVALERMQYTEMTPIQAMAIPLALLGRDVMGSAQTGTGKTAAFAVPLVARLLNNPTATALVMTPTRELAQQVLEVIKKLAPKENQIKTALLIGGEPMPPQFNQLRMKPRIIVGTPGRINDHLDRKTLQLGQADFLVLDEADRMLDMGFDVQIEAIIECMPKARQTLMFSATMPKNILRLSAQYLTNPEHLSAGHTSTPIQKIKQDIIHTSEENKYDNLVKELDNRQGSIIVFVKTKMGAEKLSARLHKGNHSTNAIHGDLRQHKRNKVIQAFRNKLHRIMIATDVAARGLDIPHIEHVINYDLPQCAEDYVHRIGRTARAGAEGSALSLISPADSKKWHAINLLLNPGSASNRRSDGGGSSERRSGPADRKYGGGSSDRKYGGGSSDRKYGRASEGSSDRKYGGGSSDRKYGGSSENAGGQRFNAERPSRPWQSDRPASKYGSSENAGGGRSNAERPSRPWQSDKPASKYGDKPRSSYDLASADRPNRSNRPEAANSNSKDIDYSNAGRKKSFAKAEVWSKKK